MESELWGYHKVNTILDSLISPCIQYSNITFEEKNVMITSEFTRLKNDKKNYLYVVQRSMANGV